MPPTLSQLKIDENTNVEDGSQDSPLLLLLVRHNGCTYCRKSLSAFQAALPDIEKSQCRLFVVHMGGKEDSQALKETYKLDGVTVLSDPQQRFYQCLGARRGSIKDVIGPAVIAKGIFSGDLLKHGIGSVKSDPFQLGGVYHIHRSEITALHIPKNTSDTENWKEILNQLPGK